MDNPYESGDRVYYLENGPTDQGIVVGPIVSPDHVTVIWESDNEITEHSLELVVAVKPDTRNVVFETEDLVGNPMVVTYTVPTEHFHPEMTELQAEEVCVGVEWTKDLKTD